MTILGELEQRAAQAIEMARAAGADEVFASASRGRGVEVEMRDGKVEKLTESTSRSLSLRLYVEGRYGTYRTSDLRDAPLRAFVRDAVAITRALEIDPHRVITDPALYEGRTTEDLGLVDRVTGPLDGAQRIAWCEAMAERARAHERVVSATVGVSDGHTMTASASSNGFHGHHERTSFSRGASVTLRDEGDARPAGSYGMAARHLEDAMDPGEVGARALEQAARRLGALKGPTGRARMVVEPRVAGRLISLLLGPASASSVSQGRTFWKHRVGERVIDERLRIVDDPWIVRGLGSRYYDGEGIAARPRTIVEGGALQMLFVDTYYGKKTGLAPTTGGSSNMLVEPGARDLDAIIADADRGYLVTGWLGGNSDATTGDFSLGLRGHLLEGGERGAAVKEMNITGNLLALFARLAEVGSDPYPHSRLRAPTLVFEDVQFSGA